MSKIKFNPHTLWAFDKTQTIAHGIITGVDEVGRGPLAGNVVAACVILDLDNPILGIRDSKKISEPKREEFYSQINEKALAWSLGQCTPNEIDDLNILGATFEAMRRALNGLKKSYNKILVDGNHEIPKIKTLQECIIKGDGVSASIAAASIMAKVTRDRQLVELDKKFPEYGFASHKGYGSAQAY